jgi:S1-C subfamily serine protease
MTLPSAADQQTPRAAENQTLTLKVEDTAPPSGPVIVIAGPPGLANRVGLVSGDVIKAINGRSIRTSNDMARWLQTLPTEKPTLFQIQRGDRVFFVAIKETVRIDG